MTLNEIGGFFWTQVNCDKHTLCIFHSEENVKATDFSIEKEPDGKYSCMKNEFDISDKTYEEMEAKYICHKAYLEDLCQKEISYIKKTYGVSK